MRDTVHCLTVDDPDEDAITQSIHDMITEVQKYVPGYTLKNGPVFDGKRVSIYMEVEGLGDFLPKYAGNLDIRHPWLAQSRRAHNSTNASRSALLERV
jgi:acetaldehyde/propanal dehydrogenase